MREFCFMPAIELDHDAARAEDEDYVERKTTKLRTAFNRVWMRWHASVHFRSSRDQTRVGRGSPCRKTVIGRGCPAASTQDLTAAR
jgi:hypothetical protein